MLPTQTFFFFILFLFFKIFYFYRKNNVGMLNCLGAGRGNKKKILFTFIFTQLKGRVGKKKKKKKNRKKKKEKKKLK